MTFAIPSTQGAIDAVGYAVVYIWAESMGQNWAEALLFICCIAQIFCLTASVTSASRMMFAFSRDGAVPGHRLWRRIVARSACRATRSCAIGVLSWALMIPTYWNTSSATSSGPRSP